MRMKLYQDRDWLYQKYWNEELNEREIGIICNVSYRNIGKQLHKLNISIRSNSEATFLRHKKENKNKLYWNEKWLREKYIIEHLDQIPIAKICGVTNGTIGKWLTKFNILKRSLSEVQKDSKYIMPTEIRKKIIETRKKNSNPNYNICLVCGKRFRTSHKDRKTCSRKCAFIRLRKQKIKEICPVCGKEFEFLPSENRKYCSTDCYNKVTGKTLIKDKIKKLCEHCGKVYEVIPALENISRFCSMECKNEGHSKAMTGKGNPIYGIIRSEETRRKIGEANSSPSEETRERMSKRSIKLWQDPEFIDKWMKGINRKPTRPEDIFNDLTPECVRYVGDGQWWRPTKKKHARNPDFKVTGQNKVIEIYGDYWHRNHDPEDIIQEYKEVGLDCLVFWEHEVYEDTERILEEVNEFIKENKTARPLQPALAI